MLNFSYQDEIYFKKFIGKIIHAFDNSNSLKEYLVKNPSLPRPPERPHRANVLCIGHEVACICTVHQSSH